MRLAYHFLSLTLFCLLSAVLLLPAYCGWIGPLLWALLYRSHHDERLAQILDGRD